MSTNAKIRYNISKVFGPAVPDKGSKDSDLSADNMAGIAINGKTAYCAKRSQTSSNIFVIEILLPPASTHLMEKHLFLFPMLYMV